MIKPSSYDIQVKDSVVNPNTPVRKAGVNAYYKTTQTKKASNLYKVHIYLTGNDLAFVKRAKYVLHESFSNPVQIVARSVRNQNCMLTIWTWGIFDIKVEVEDTQGNTIRLSHRLSYGEQIKGKNDIQWTKE